VAEAKRLHKRGTGGTYARGAFRFSRIRESFHFPIGGRGCRFSAGGPAPAGGGGGGNLRDCPDKKTPFGISEMGRCGRWLSVSRIRAGQGRFGPFRKWGDLSRGPKLAGKGGAAGLSGAPRSDFAAFAFGDWAQTSQVAAEKNLGALPQKGRGLIPAGRIGKINQRAGKNPCVPRR